MEPIVPNRLALGWGLTCWGQHVPPWLAKLLRSRGRRARRRPASGGSLILRAAESENREENDSQKSEADSEAHAFSEAFRQIDAENYADNKIHERDKHQNDPPPWPADDLAPNVNVIDWDDRGPTGLAGFGKHFPHRHDQEQRDEQSDNYRDWAWRLTLSGVLDLSE